MCAQKSTMYRLYARVYAVASSGSVTMPSQQMPSVGYSSAMSMPSSSITARRAAGSYPPGGQPSS